jgi:hypothetical protein
MFKGYRFLDADAHILEPDDLFEKYLEPKFRSRMPRAWTGYKGEPPAWGIEVITPPRIATAASARCRLAATTIR